MRQEGISKGLSHTHGPKDAPVPKNWASGVNGAPLSAAVTTDGMLHRTPETRVGFPLRSLTPYGTDGRLSRCALGHRSGNDLGVVREFDGPCKHKAWLVI